MLSGEHQHERILTEAEERVYLGNASPLLYAVAIILLDCGLKSVSSCAGTTTCGATASKCNMAKRITHAVEFQFRHALQRSWKCAERRRTNRPGSSQHQRRAATWSHRDVKKHHYKACRGVHAKEEGSQLESFPFYTLRHTCLTRWAPHRDPWTLAKLAGHRDMSITKRYIHPEEATVRAAMERARDAKGGHKIGHMASIGTGIKPADASITN